MREKIIRFFLLGVIVLAVVFAVAMKTTVFQQEAKPTTPTTNTAESPQFRKYWFSGKAEINSYTLEQAQYGALNPGKAVLIFVTEDFRTDTQVKSESEASRDKATPVLKTNLVKKFVTGIYDYSLFTSVFTPISAAAFPYTLKVSTSGQEWCGHSYMQLNYRGGGYEVAGRSYFEKEVDENYKVGRAVLEDELWNRIRLAPDKLPTGDVTLIPGTQTARLRHKRLDPIPATVTLTDYAGSHFQGKALKAYTVDYKQDGRVLTIIFENAFPYQIIGWEETYETKGKQLTSRAVLQKTIQNDYWSHNAPADTTLRKTLAIP